MPDAPAGAPVRVGVIGAGAICRDHHIPSLARMPGAVLVAVADPDPGARERVRAGAGAAVHEDPGELIARGDLDAVVIGAPSHLHADLAVAAAQAGLHAYVEKPVAVDAAGADRVRRAVGDAGTIAAVGFNRRMHPLYRHARRLVERGRIGPLVAAQTIFSEPVVPARMPAWKKDRATGGGVLLDLASHHLDQLRWLTGEEVASVSATCASDVSEQDGAWLELRLGGGAIVQCAFSFRGGFADHIELVGERGTLRVDRHRAALGLRLRRRRGYGLRVARPLPSRELVAWRARRPVGGPAEPSYAASLAAFVDQVRGGPAAAASLDDGLRSLAIVLAAEESARTGGVVPCGSS